MKKNSDQALSYRDAGVNIDAGNQLVTQIKSLAKATQGPEVLTNLGGFGGLFQFPNDHYKQPVFVAGTDGVGTKLKLALELNNFATIGIDLVAMCVNDIIVSGAKPLFFLDYYACGRLDVTQASEVIKGIANGCQQAGCALIGGETAEMPGMYQAQDFDLAGFSVGVVEKKHIIDGKQVKPGDVLIGLASSGPHANGYSLIRTILQHTNSTLSSALDKSTLGEILLTPTRIYVKTLLTLFKQINIKAIAHITGGGLLENIPRVLPNHTQAIIKKNNWQWPTIFTWLQQQGQISELEMYRTFNCGIGMVVCVASQDADPCLQLLKQANEHVSTLGTIEKSSDQSPSVKLV